MVKKKCCVFISGAGSNLKALIQSTRDYNFPVNIDLVISNKKNAKGLNFAKLNSIYYSVFNFKKKSHFEILLNQLKKRKISLICLAGYMKILPENFLKRFNGKIINIHPSLLPKYKGLNTYEKILKNKDKFGGCSVHYVNKKLDSGKIILQKKINIKNDETVHSLKARVQNCEYRAYSEAVIIIFS